MSEMARWKKGDDEWVWPACVPQDEGLDWGLCLRRLASYDAFLLEDTPVNLNLNLYTMVEHVVSLDEATTT